MAVAVKANAGALFILDGGGIKPAKTQELIAILWPEKKGDSVLLVVHAQKDDGAREIHLAGRNLRRASVVAHNDISAHAILAHDRLVVSRNALDALAEVCGG
jgi:ribosomal protein L4